MMRSPTIARRLLPSAKYSGSARAMGEPVAWRASNRSILSLNS